MLTAAKTNLAELCKRDWKAKIGGYTAMAKLTEYIHNRRLTIFQQARFLYTQHITQCRGNLDICRCLGNLNRNHQRSLTFYNINI